MTEDAHPIWIARAGRYGEDEEDALAKSLAIIGFRGFPDLTQFGSVDDLVAFHRQDIEPDAPTRRSRNLAQQLWTFRQVVQPGDLVVLPLKTRSGQIAIGRITGPYRYLQVGDEKRHTRAVEWTHPDLPRSAFQQDLLYSFGAFITVCRIRRNNAEHRVAAVLAGNADPGPDAGADILAGSGPLGLDPPFLCVQVKATQRSTDIKVFRELAGTMAAFKATQGLLVSWGGFTQAVVREARKETFTIRLWDQERLGESDPPDLRSARPGNPGRASPQAGVDARPRGRRRRRRVPANRKHSVVLGLRFAAVFSTSTL